MTISNQSTFDYPIQGEVLATELLGGDLLVEANVDETRVIVKTDSSYLPDKVHNKSTLNSNYSAY